MYICFGVFGKPCSIGRKAGIGKRGYISAMLVPLSVLTHSWQIASMPLWDAMVFMYILSRIRGGTSWGVMVLVKIVARQGVNVVLNSSTASR